jgi:hypothetical protein
MLSYKKNLLVLLIILYTQIYSQIDTSSTIWILDRTDNIGGFNTAKLTELPVPIETPQGKSLLFDGVNRALIVKGNPLGSSKSFTIEILFRPDTASAITNKEQRYLHIRSSADDNRRVMMELRIISKTRWTIDTYIKSETSSCTLLDDTTKASSYSHPVGPWYHAALVYENGIMKHFVNGIEELGGQVFYVPIENGQISIGARQDPKSWFKGQ